MKLLVNRLPGVLIRLGALLKMGVVGTAYSRCLFYVRRIFRTARFRAADVMGGRDFRANGIIGPAGFPFAVGCPAVQHDRIVASEQVASDNLAPIVVSSKLDLSKEVDRYVETRNYNRCEV